MDTAQPQEHDQRGGLADAIERRAQDIVDEWLPTVQRDANASHVSLTDLQDGILDYLKRLATLLRENKSLETVGTSAWADVARQHALNRVRLGFDVTQLVRELVILRRITAKTLRAEYLMSPEQIEQVIGLIDAAMIASLQSYIEYRDYSTRRMEAQHIGFLTHELKNPLHVALMACEDICAQTRTSEEARLCDMLHRSLDRISKTIDGALFTERLEAGEVEVHPVDVTLGALLRDTLEPFERTAREKGIELVSRFDPNLQMRVDLTLTLSAIENLLDNAIKYTDRGRVELEVEDTPEEFVFHARDQCSGLSPEELRVIFEPFKRAHSKKPGTGLGLAITRRAVELQGGKIHAESAYDVGCHFWFTVPKTHH